MKLREYLQEQKISQRELARRLSISYSYIYMIMSGTRRPSVDVAREIVKMTNNEVTLDELLPAKQHEKCPHCGKKMCK